MAQGTFPPSLEDPSRYIRPTSVLPWGAPIKPWASPSLASLRYIPKLHMC